MRALVVDDSRVMRSMIKRILVAKGFDVGEAGHGGEAMDWFRANGKPDVILVDWNMPVMNGLELIKAVRKDPDLKHTPMVMVTTETENSQVVRALAAGATEYLMKPFVPEALLSKLEMIGVITS